MARIKAYCGADPGKSGAAALLLPDNTVHFIDWNDSETYMAGLLKEWNQDYDIQLCLLERVWAFPGQGVSSVFTFGTNYGTWRGMLAVLGIPFILETPQAWMKGLVEKKESDKKKGASMATAQRLFPKADIRLKKHDGRADAALMAYVARQRHIKGA